MKNLITLFMSIMPSVAGLCQNNPLWLRYPAISPDGQTILFTFKGDIYTVSSAGGEANRLTFHSTGEIPSTFTTDDEAVLFSAVRQDVVTNIQYPTGLMSELYSVPLEPAVMTGGRDQQIEAAVKELMKQ